MAKDLGAERRLGLAATSTGQTGKEQMDTDKHAGKQCLGQCRGGYLGPDVLGFLFRLTLLRAHGKGGEQGPSIGKEGRVSVPQTYGCLLSLRFPSHWSSQPPFS